MAVPYKDFTGMLVSSGAIEVRELALSRMWELITHEAMKIALGLGERTVTRAHVKEAIRQQGETFQKLMEDLQ